MIRSMAWNASLCAALMIMHAGIGEAQQAMTVTGHVTYRGTPLVGARVRFAEFGTERVTDADGRYSFVIPSVNVRGQTVTLTARMDDRRIRYRPQSVEVALNGRAIVQDFDLAIASDGVIVPEPSARGGTGRAIGTSAPVFDDTLGLAEQAGSVSILEMLAGRIPGLDVRTAAALGGSTALEYRGPRSLAGTGQPLFIVDGVARDNTVFSSSAQRFGLGGFDLGSPLQDLSLENIASLRWLSRTEATARFGGMASNGALLVTTRDGSDVLGFAISASQQVTSSAPLRLSEYQNQYGQGLNGAFEFFDGRGGGINDNVDESWGPALDGRPLQQASLTEAGRPDVRLWSARPDNVRNYFNGGRTTTTTAAVQRGGLPGSIRLHFGNRDTRGISPGQSLVRREGGASVALTPSARFAISANVSASRTTNANAPGTGDNEGNPVSQFARMGRQVDTDTLRTRLRDSAGRQISWSYTGHNNPYFAALENDNSSVRSHTVGTAAASYALTSWLTASARGGMDDYGDDRRFTIASGWMGGYPTLDGPGDYSRGGFQRDDISARRTTAALRFDVKRSLSGDGHWTTSVGSDREVTRTELSSTGTDSMTTALEQAGSAVEWLARSTRTGVFGETGMTRGGGALMASLRREQWSAFAEQQSATLYPAVRASYDFGKAMPALRNARGFSGLAVHAEWSRTGGELSPYVLQTLYAGRTPTSSIAPSATGSVLPDSALSPEITSAFEAGATFAFAASRLKVGATAYSERTTGVILPLYTVTRSATVSANLGELTNRGVETHASLRLGDGETGFGWAIAASASRNDNEVVRLLDGMEAIPIGPANSGIAVEARVGAPLGVLVGTRLRRDVATGGLILRNGLPQADSIAGLVELGSRQPKWVVGLRNSLRYRWVALGVIADGRIGGAVFSATKRQGSYSGALQQTAFRPDTGLLIVGVNAANGQANAQHVSVQDYYHALGAIGEPWIVSATYFKLRETRLSVTIPSRLPRLPFESASISLVGRNLLMWSRDRDVDPESILSPYQYPGVELGQLPFARTIGLQVSIQP